MIRDLVIPLGKVRERGQASGMNMMTISLSFQFLIVVECVFCVVSTPGGNKKTPGLGPPGATRDHFVVTGAPSRHERGAADIVHNSSGNIVTLNMFSRILYLDV